jgi:hypothetical protein
MVKPEVIAVPLLSAAHPRGLPGEAGIDRDPLHRAPNAKKVR